MCPLIWNTYAVTKVPPVFNCLKALSPEILTPNLKVARTTGLNTNLSNEDQDRDYSDAGGMHSTLPVRGRPKRVTLVYCRLHIA